MNSIKEFFTYITNQLKFWFIIKEWEFGLQLRNGKIIRSLNHGVYFKIPFLDFTYAKPKRLQDVVISQVNFTTKDDKSLTVSACAFFKINDIEKYYNGYAEPLSIIDNIIKNLCNQYFLKTRYDKFEQLGFEKYVFERLENIKDKGFEFTEFGLTTFSNARTYRIIKDNLYSQLKSELDKQTY